MTKPKHGGRRPGAGRPPLYPDQPSVVVMVRMTEGQREKLRKLGGPAWVRKKIDNSR